MSGVSYARVASRSRSGRDLTHRGTGEEIIRPSRVTEPTRDAADWVKAKNPDSPVMTRDWDPDF